MIQFDKKISIDGVAVLTIGVAAIVYINSMRNTLDTHTEQIKNHEAQLQKMTDTQTALQINLSVLTALQKQNNGLTIDTTGAQPKH